ARRRGAVVEALNSIPGIRCGAPGGAFYAFPEISGTGYRASVLQDRLLDDAGVATVSGSGFGPGGEGHLRLSFTAKTDVLLQAVQRMAAVVLNAAPTRLRGSLAQVKVR